MFTEYNGYQNSLDTSAIPYGHLIKTIAIAVFMSLLFFFLS